MTDQVKTVPKADEKPIMKAPETPTPPEPKVPTKSTGPVVREDSWLYHKVEEPKLHKEGDAVLEGWGPDNKYGWYRDVKSNFHWRKR